MTYTFKQTPEFTHALSRSVLETCNIDLLLNKERVASYSKSKLSSERKRFDHFWSTTRKTLAKNCVTFDCLQIWPTRS